VQLSDYEAATFQLAEILRAIAALDLPNPSPFTDPVRELFARLAEGRFNLVVIGRFSRGKTSLMNAILGTERLPTGILPLTSVVTRVAYGSREKVEIEFTRGGMPLEIAMEQLRDYVTQHGNPGNRLGIRQAVVELPAEILRRGFYFIDTPGLGSAISENSRTTEKFLPEADAVLMVSGCDSPLTEEEAKLIRRLARDRRKLFLIMNKQDMLTPEGRLELVQFTREQLSDLPGEAAPPLFLVSARDGLLGKLRGDRALLDSSGLAALENALIAFLTRDKSKVLLQAMAARLYSLLDAIDAMSVVEPDVLRDLSGRIAAFERELGLDSDTGVINSDSATSPMVLNAPARMGACSVCSRILSAWFEFLRRYQLELAISAEERHRFAQRGGFCGRHLGLYVSLASERDLCLALTPLLERTAIDLAEASHLGRREGGGSGKAAFTRLACALCEIQHATETDCFREFSQTFEQRPGDLNTPLPSVCLTHLKLMAQGEWNAPRRGISSMLEAFLRQQAAAAQRLAEDTQRYVLKRDALRHGLASEEESQAAGIAVAFLIGHPKVMPGDGQPLSASRASGNKSHGPPWAKKA
jgi:GTPase SAR1 family protein